MITEFSERKTFNLNRLRKISVEAIEQSNSIKIPEICEVQNITNLMKNWDNKRMIFFCDECGGNSILSSQKIIQKYRKFAIFIGPIGGWSSSDRKLFSNLKINKCSLGNNLLKADTAAIYSLSCLRALIE